MTSETRKVDLLCKIAHHPIMAIFLRRMYSMSTWLKQHVVEVLVVIPNLSDLTAL